MKKRIFIAIIVLAVCTAIGLCLYFFVFKSNSLSEMQARALVIDSSIDVGVIDDYEGAPKFDKLDFGSGDNNIINKNLVPLEGVRSRLSQQSIDDTNPNYQDGEDRFEDILSLCANFFKKDVKQGNVYLFTHEGTTYRMSYNIIGYEVIINTKFTNPGDPQNQLYTTVSFFYDSKDDEFELVYVGSTSDEMEIMRFKYNSEGLISYEEYVLSGITGEDAVAKINNSESSTTALIVDYQNNLQKIGSLDGTTAPDDNYNLSMYIYNINKNYSDVTKDYVKLINETEEPIDLSE